MPRIVNFLLALGVLLAALIYGAFQLIFGAAEELRLALRPFGPANRLTEIFLYLYAYWRVLVPSFVLILAWVALIRRSRAALWVFGVYFVAIYGPNLAAGVAGIGLYEEYRSSGTPGGLSEMLSDPSVSSTIFITTQVILWTPVVLVGGALIYLTRVGYWR